MSRLTTGTLLRPRFPVNKRPDGVLIIAAELDVMCLRGLCAFGGAAFCLMSMIKAVLNIVTALKNFGFDMFRVSSRVVRLGLIKKLIGNQFQSDHKFFIDSAALAFAMTVIGKSRLIHIKEAEQK